MKTLERATPDTEVAEPKPDCPQQVGRIISEEQLSSLYNNLERCSSDKQRLNYKLSFAKKMFSDCSVVKTGKNAFQKFEYFELKDIMPPIIDIFCDLMLSTKFTFNVDDKTSLKIEDCETGQYTLFSIPTPKNDGGNSNKQIQDIGKLSTYTRRYTFLIALDIVETDEIDQKSGKGTPTNKPTHKTVRRMTVNEVNKHMQKTLSDIKNFDEAKDELNKLKMEDKISQTVYETVYANIEKASGE